MDADPRTPHRGHSRQARIMIVAAALFGTAGGLFLAPYLPLPSLMGFAILGIGITVLLVGVWQSAPR